MKLRNTASFGWALGAFCIGTLLALGYVTSGASLVLSRGGWPKVALYPGFIVGYHMFYFVDYSIAVSLACLTVGIAYALVAWAIAGIVRQMRPSPLARPVKVS